MAINAFAAKFGTRRLEFIELLYVKPPRTVDKFTFNHESTICSIPFWRNTHTRKVALTTLNEPNLVPATNHHGVIVPRARTLGQQGGRLKLVGGE